MQQTGTTAFETRVLARGKDWTLSECVCNAGPQHAPFEEQHEGFTIAAVVEGNFVYHSDTGRKLQHPGSLLLGNHGAYFQCGHDHGTGDRCIALNFAASLFAEIAASATGRSSFRFPTGMLPVSRRVLPLVSRLAAAPGNSSPLRLEEFVTDMCESVIGELHGHAETSQRVGAREERRVADVLRFIERNASDRLQLEEFADMARMSKYHFLRVFRKVAGVTPYQYMLSVRLRRAASQLIGSNEAVSAIAFEAGFGDLSTFNRRFRQHFGVNPSAFRRQAR